MTEEFSTTSRVPVRTISDPEVLQALAHPTRIAMLDAFRRPASTAAVARQLGQPRQRLAFHLKLLKEADLVAEVAKRNTGRFVETLYQATAETFIVSPEALWSDPKRKQALHQQLSLNQLVSAGRRLQTDALQLLDLAAFAEQTIPSMTLTGELRFADERRRTEFFNEYTEAITELSERFTHREGAAYRLVTAVHPEPELDGDSERSDQPNQAAANQYTKSFSVDVPLARLWQAFRDNREYGALLAWPDSPGEHQQDPQRKRVLEAEEERWLKFEQITDGIGERAQFTVAFESTKTGSRFTVTRFGFGEGDTDGAFAESNFLGFCHGFADLVFFLESGVPARRHRASRALSATGMVYRDRDWGVEVVAVADNTFAQRAGLASGDRLLSFNQTPIYSRQEIWSFLNEHDAGTEVAVEFVRAGQSMSGQAELSPPEDGNWGE